MILVHSLMRIAARAALLSAFATPYELVHLMRTTKCTRIFVSPNHLPIALKAAKEIGFPEDRFYILEGHIEGKKSFADMIDDTRRKKLPRVGMKPAKKDDLLFIVMSSGTSGLPKCTPFLFHCAYLFILMHSHSRHVHTRYSNIYHNPVKDTS